MPRPVVGRDPSKSFGESGDYSPGGSSKELSKPGKHRGRIVVNQSEGADDDVDEDEGEDSDDLPSEEECFTEADRKSAGDRVEQVRLPTSIRELYSFLELVHDSGEGHRVYMCEDSLAPRLDPAAEGRRASTRHSVIGQSVRKERAKVGVDKSEAAKEKRKIESEQEFEQQVAATLGLARRCIVKVWQKAARSREETQEWLEMQLKLLRMERHPNILFPRRIREDEHAYYVEFDAVVIGCSLLQTILNDASTTENQVKRIARQMLLGLQHLHKRGFSHGDVKAENVMLEWVKPHRLLAKHAKVPVGWRSTKTGIRQWRPPARFKNAWHRHDLHIQVRIVDMDTVSGPESKNICGTPGYMAPEACLACAGAQGDLFGVGIIMYLLFRCAAPCHDAAHAVLGGESLARAPKARRERLKEAVSAELAKIDWKSDPWPSAPLARDLCRQLLNVKPHFRGQDAEDVLKSAPFFQRSITKLGAEAIEALTALKGQASWESDEVEGMPPATR